MIEKVICDDCTDKGNCPEYKAGAVCVINRERISKDSDTNTIRRSN